MSWTQLSPRPIQSPNTVLVWALSASGISCYSRTLLLQSSSLQICVFFSVQSRFHAAEAKGMEVTIAEKKPRAVGDGGGLVDRLPEALLVEVLARVDVDGACSAASSCRSLYSAANAVLPALTSIDLSVSFSLPFSPTARKTGSFPFLPH
jgi:hypothetical protein